MSTIELTSKNFEQTITSNEVVFVDFWASWCGPCRQFAPVYEKAAASNPDIVFGSVNTETQPALAAAGQVTSIPTLMVFKNGSLIFAQPGALPAAALDQVIASARAFDVEQSGQKAAGRR